ncbi:hypothetical protein UlMin_007463 [Ulmus minor]
MASLQSLWFTSLNTKSPTKPTFLSSPNVHKSHQLRPFRVNFSLNSENVEASQPILPNSPETLPEAEVAPIDPVKLAFGKAKEYKKSIQLGPKLKLEQNPVDDSDGIANGNSQLDAPKSIQSSQRLKIEQNPDKDNGNSGSELVQGSAGDETKELPDSVKLAMEKVKEYKKNKGLKEMNGGDMGNGTVEKKAKKKGELSVSSIDFVGLNFADKKQSRGLPAGLVPVADSFPEGDISEVEIIVGDTSKFADKTSSKPDQAQEKDLEAYKPKVTSWGVFPRPSNISKAFGGGRVINPGQALETAEEKAAKEARTRELLAAYKSQIGLNIDPKLKSECEEALKEGDSLMNLGRLKEALPYYEKVMEKLTFKSELHGLAALQWSICQDSLRRSKEARLMYEKLQSHPNAKVSKKARQFMFSFQAMEMMKMTTHSPFSMNTGYQNYFEAFIEKKANFLVKEGEDEDSVGGLIQTLPYILVLVSPIFIVLLIAVQKRI